MKFTKMHGTGNDFIVFEDLENQYEDLAALSKKLCSRHFGVGGDGILVVKRSTIADIQMIITNADGSYASMCGNGIRCFAKYVYEKKLIDKTRISIETGDGIKEAQLHIVGETVQSITIDMGKPSFEPSTVPVNFQEEVVNKKICIDGKEYNIHTMLMGVPHTVIIGKLSDYEVEEGKAIEKYAVFPQGTNVNFCEVVNRDKILVKTWERGAGPTLACGTGSCASVIACSRLGLINKRVVVEVPGGSLDIEINERGVYMTGPAEIVFEGIIK